MGRIKGGERHEIIFGKELHMIKVKTFTSPLRIFHVHNELTTLDKEVNDFLQVNNIKKVISICDSTTHTDGNTMGIIRVVTYEE